MPKISIRYQELGDAKRFFEILSNPNFIYFTSKPKSVQDEIKWLKKSQQLRKAKSEYNYTILLDGSVIGAVGIRIDKNRSFTGEIGYFVDERHWNKGIATKAVKLAEKEGFSKRGLTRIVILMQPENIGSERVAIKSGFQKEGLMKKAIIGTDGKKKDVFLYAKVKS